MDTSTTYEPGTGVRTLDRGIRIGRYLLTLITILALPLIALGLSGRGSMTLSADLEDAYIVEFADGRRIGVSGANLTYENFEVGRESGSLAGVDSVALDIRVARSDRDSRAAIAAIALGWLAAAWIGLSSLGRVATDAISGRAFADENPRRLRWLGASIMAVPIMDLVGRAVLDRTLDADLPVTVALPGTSLWVLAAIGVGMFALAEVFAEAARLREFEEATV